MRHYEVKMKVKTEWFIRVATTFIQVANLCYFSKIGSKHKALLGCRITADPLGRIVFIRGYCQNKEEVEELLNFCEPSMFEWIHINVQDSEIEPPRNLK